MSKAKRRPSVSIEIGGKTVAPGARGRIDIPVARLPATQTFVHLPVIVVNGQAAGPHLWLSAAIHGDELNGIEIIRAVLDALRPAKLCGTVIAVPVVNVFGLLAESRYLPDRRDLNRSFPGSSRGSLAARLAALFMKEIVANSTHGIDFHTGSDHRTNLPQIRADLDDPETSRCVDAFGAPVKIHAPVRDGSLRGSAAKLGIPTLLFEGGEPLRFDPDVIDAGARGVRRVMREIGMLPKPKTARRRTSIEIRRSRWVRARASGLLRLTAALGDRVSYRQVLGSISDAFGEMRVSVRSPANGIIVGHTNNPLVRQGDGIVHVGFVPES